MTAISTEGPSAEGPSAVLALSNALADIVDRVGRSVVAINARRRRSSSGVLWRSGIIVTAEHTISRDAEIRVTLPDDRTVTATLVGRDPGTDLAVLRLDATEAATLPTVTVDATASLQVGHLALALGRSLDSGISASLGVISAVGGTWQSWHGGRIDRFIRPALMLYPGTSGGPLVNAQGQVVGINTAGPRHMTLTIPVETVNRVVDQLISDGRIARGYLGVGMQPVQLPTALLRSLDLSQAEGVLVVSVAPDAPADQAGVLIGDILIALDGTPISDVSDVHALLAGDRIGQPLTAQFIRGGRLQELTITVGERSTRGV